MGGNDGGIHAIAYWIFRILYSIIALFRCKSSVFLFKINGYHQFDYTILQFEFDGKFVGCLRVWSIIINETKQLNFIVLLNYWVILGRWELWCNQQIIDYMSILEMIFPFAIHHSMAFTLPISIPISILISFDFDFIVNCYVCIFPSSLMGTPSIKMCWFEAILQAYFMISTMAYVCEVAIEERVILQRNFYRTIKSTERIFEISRQIQRNTTNVVSNRRNKEKH